MSNALISAPPLSRRSLLRLGAISAAAIALGACSGESGRKAPPPLPSTAAPSGGPRKPITTVTTAAPHVQESGLPLDATPYWKQPTIGEPQAVVDARASVFLVTADERDAELFLMGWIPNVDIDSTLLGEAIDPPSVLGGAWASGYWHGAYLQSLVNATTPPSRSGTADEPVNRFRFLRLVESALRTESSQNAGGEPLLQAVDASLWRSPALSTSPSAFFGLVEKFGGSYGEFRTLRDRRPDGAEPLEEFDVVCVGGASCEFTTERLNATSQLNTRFAQRLLTDRGLVGVRRRVDQVIADSTTRGRAVALELLDTTALDPADYRRLVDLYSSRLEARWCAMIAALEAVVQRDESLATTAASATGLLELWDNATRHGRARVEPYRAPDFVST